MRKSVFATLLLLVSFVIASCSSAKKELRDEVEAVNKSCPISAGMVGNVTGYEYNESNDEVTMTVLLAENLPMKLSALNQMKDVLKRTALSNFTTSEDIIKMMKTIAKAKAKLTIVYQAAKSDETMKIEITNQDVQNVVDGKVGKLTPKEQLEINVMSANAQCPMQVDEATTMEKVSLEGNQFIYNYTVNEDVVTIEQLEENKEVLRSNILQTLTSQDPSLVFMINACKEGNISIVYHYVGNNSGEETELEFTPSEL